MTLRDDIAALRAEIEQGRARAEAAEQELRDVAERRFVAVVGACDYELKFVRITHVLGPFVTEEEAHDAAERVKPRVDLDDIGGYVAEEGSTVEHDVLTLTTPEEAAIAADPRSRA